MKVLYFDCFSGISGDMTLGALIDLGIEPENFKKELKKLDLSGYEIFIEKKQKNGIAVTDVEVAVEDTHNGHADGHRHGHSARNLKDIKHLINSSTLSKKVKDFSIKAFEELAQAEAKVHNKTIDEVHFHEVGAVDSIIDIVGSAICLDLIGAKKIYSSFLHDGQGFIECQHGLMPVPVPAVMEMLKESSIPLVIEDVYTEMVTPTGMALIKTMTSNFGKMPRMDIKNIGYGMGKRETGKFNALRVIEGTLLEKGSNDEVVVLETNIDDMSPEILGYTMEKLFDKGALDVFYTPIYMKKNRPGVMLTVLTDEKHEVKLIDIILNETSTLGIRRNISKRYCMYRETVNVNTEYGEVRIKIASKGDFKKIAPEYEDCRQIAKKTGLPLSRVYDIVYENLKKYVDGSGNRHF